MIRGHMLGKAMLPGDEELGKKDDDHRFAPAQRSGWSIWNHTFRWRRRRILMAVAGLALVYVVLNAMERFNDGRQLTPISSYIPAYNDGLEPQGAPPGIQVVGGETPHTFDGRIRFYRLAKSLRKSAAHTNGYDETNQNVLFAMSSLTSASNLLPMVCEMSKWSRNYVHAAFMGRENIPLEELLQINGVTKESCPAIWHDARSDYSEYSSDTRAESAVIGALSHIQSMVHPQAAIIDDSSTEDAFFVKGMRNKTNKFDIPLIEVPKDRWENFMWITRLDAGSLKHWHSPMVDILIQVPSESSSVLRLLKSIKDADYAGMKPPRLVLELPAKLDESVKRQVESFQWPPHKNHASDNSGLVIRRRIMSHRATQEDAAIRFLELFYPTSTTNSHVMLLSSQAQLSPLYYHFIMYTLLEYKFSKFGKQDGSDLFGVSLELPSVLLDGKTKLTPPTLDDMYTTRFKQLFPNTPTAPFLWQAPNSHATLLFGDKWAELHSFLSNRVVKHQESRKSVSRKKLVSETLPAWTEYMLEFMRARAYTILYPAKTTESLVTIHNELYHAPEEYSAKSHDEKDPMPESVADEPFLRGEVPSRPPSNPESRTVPGSKPLHLALPFDGDLPEVPHLPHLLYNGTLIFKANVSQTALEYANTFREEVGGCTLPKGKHRVLVPGEARDLFCFGDEEEKDWEDDESAEVHTVDRLLVDEEGQPLPAWPEKVLAMASASASATFTTARPTLVEADEF
jgi:hypothetical protein